MKRHDEHAGEIGTVIHEAGGDEPFAKECLGDRKKERGARPQARWVSLGIFLPDERKLREDRDTVHSC